MATDSGRRRNRNVGLVVTAAAPASFPAGRDPRLFGTNARTRMQPRATRRRARDRAECPPEATARAVRARTHSSEPVRSSRPGSGIRPCRTTASIHVAAPGPAIRNQAPQRRGRQAASESSPDLSSAHRRTGKRPPRTETDVPPVKRISALFPAAGNDIDQHESLSRLHDGIMQI